MFSPERKNMETCLISERGFNLSLFIGCLIAMPIYLVGMLIASFLSKFEKPDPFERLFPQQQEKGLWHMPINDGNLINRSLKKSPT
jgi:hypothetical protein